jgi:hypothetical protein
MTTTSPPPEQVPPVLLDVRAVAALLDCSPRHVNRRQPWRPVVQASNEGADLDDIGLLLRRRVVPVYFIWSMQSYEILLYGQLLRDYLAWVRQSTKDHTFYIEFDLLRERVAALQKKRSGLEPAYTEEELREFLEDEAEMASGADPHKGAKRGRRRFQARCPHCEQRLSIYTSNLGRKRKCPRCSGEFTLREGG